MACSKGAPPGEAAASADAAPGVSIVAAASVAPAASATAAPATAAAGSFAGSYDAKAGTLYVPDQDDWKSVKWRGDEATEGLGAGTLSLAIDADGTVHGESAGALGAMLIVGQADAGVITATLTRKNPDDGGFTGTLRATKKDAGYAGELDVSRGNASVIRSGTFQLAAK